MILTFAILKQIISKRLEASVNIAEIIMLSNRLNCKRLYMKIPRHAEIRFVIKSIKIVFRNPRLTRFRFISIDTFIIAEINDIKK